MHCNMSAIHSQPNTRTSTCQQPHYWMSYFGRCEIHIWARSWTLRRIPAFISPTSGPQVTPTKESEREVSRKKIPKYVTFVTQAAELKGRVALDTETSGPVGGGSRGGEHLRTPGWERPEDSVWVSERCGCGGPQALDAQCHYGLC